MNTRRTRSTFTTTHKTARLVIDKSHATKQHSEISVRTCTDVNRLDPERGRRGHDAHLTLTARQIPAFLCAARPEEQSCCNTKSTAKRQQTERTSLRTHVLDPACTQRLSCQFLFVKLFVSSMSTFFHAPFSQYCETAKLLILCSDSEIVRKDLKLRKNVDTSLCPLDSVERGQRERKLDKRAPRSRVLSSRAKGHASSDAWPSVICSQKSSKSGVLGSPARTRTSNLVVNSHPLYQLSYRGILCAKLLQQKEKV